MDRRGRMDTWKSEDILPALDPSGVDLTCHLLTRSLELIAKKVESASVATAFAKKDLPVPGGPYSRIPEQQMQRGIVNKQTEIHIGGSRAQLLWLREGRYHVRGGPTNRFQNKKIKRQLVPK